MMEISVGELKRILDGGEDIRLIDVRLRNDFLQGSIEGSDNIPLGMIACNTQSYISDKKIIFCCLNGERSTKASTYLEKINIETIVLSGGIESWQASGYILTKPI